MKDTIKYNSGWKRLDNFLSAVAYGVVLTALVTIAGLLSTLLWVHWRMYG